MACNINCDMLERKQRLHFGYPLWLDYYVKLKHLHYKPPSNSLIYSPHIWQLSMKKIQGKNKTKQKKKGKKKKKKKGSMLMLTALKSFALATILQCGQIIIPLSHKEQILEKPNFELSK